MTSIDCETYVNFEDRIDEDKIHGSGKDGNRFLLHY
jgi:hypothetical protein